MIMVLILATKTSLLLVSTDKFFDMRFNVIAQIFINILYMFCTILNIPSTFIL